MRTFFGFLLMIILSLSAGCFVARDGKSSKVEKSEKKAEKVKEKQKKAYLLSQKKDKKRRYDMQTAETKKRMKENKRSAKRINDQNHRSFFQQLFHRKK